MRRGLPSRYLKAALGVVLIIAGGAVSVQALTAPGAAWAELLREGSDVTKDQYVTLQQMLQHWQARDEAATGVVVCVFAGLVLGTIGPVFGIRAPLELIAAVIAAFVVYRESE
jgi:hypothetical protein